MQAKQTLKQTDFLKQTNRRIVGCGGTRHQRWRDGVKIRDREKRGGSKGTLGVTSGHNQQVTLSGKSTDYLERRTWRRRKVDLKYK